MTWKFYKNGLTQITTLNLLHSSMHDAPNVLRPMRQTAYYTKLYCTIVKVCSRICLGAIRYRRLVGYSSDSPPPPPRIAPPMCLLYATVIFSIALWNTWKYYISKRKMKMVLYLTITIHRH